MNWNLPLLAASAFAALSLASCGTTTGGSGTTIMYPTVSEMERYEAQWGMQPRAVPARAATSAPTTSAFVPQQTSRQVVTTGSAAAAPSAPVPVETIQPAAPAPPTPPPAIPPALR